MAKMIEVKAQTRKKMAARVLEVINSEGQDNIIEIIMDEGGKFAGGGLLASIRAYIFIKD